MLSICVISISGFKWLWISISGFKFDKYLCCHDQIKQVCKSSFYFIRNIAKIRNYLTDSATESVVHAFITSKLDYCNSLYYGLPKYLLKRLQCIQNSAARLVVQASKFEHVTPVLLKLHWLPVRFRIMFKILLMVYKCLHDMAPPYLANVIKPRKTSRSLRSTTMEYLEEQRSRLVTYGDRSFSVAGPKLWNNLPLQIRKSSSIQSFKKELKSHLFKNFLSFGLKRSLMRNDILLLLLYKFDIYFLLLSSAMNF